MAFSAGFSPHPKVSYANSAPTGVASEAEYVEIGVTERCDPAAVRAALAALDASVAGTFRTQINWAANKSAWPCCNPQKEACRC